jgi:long-subunit acyl-CoA synthetase (AMP-forming)
MSPPIPTLRVFENAMRELKLRSEELRKLVSQGDIRAKKEGASMADLAVDPQLISVIQTAVDEANKAVSKAESIRKFRILTTDFTIAGGQLTAKLSVKRHVVAQEFAAEIEALYEKE